MSELRVIRTAAERELEERQVEVIEILETLITRAQSGELLGILAVIETVGDGLETQWSGAPDTRQRIGALAMLQAQLISDAFDDPD